MDDMSKANKMNAEYKNIILTSENKLSEVNNEIWDLQKLLDLKTKTIQRAADETMVYKKQIEKLLNELKDKSDTESFDDEK